MHLVQLNCICFMLLAPLIQFPKESNSVSSQGKVTLSLHMYIKYVQFYKCKVAFIAIKLLLFHVVVSLDTVSQGE